MKELDEYIVDLRRVSGCPQAYKWTPDDAFFLAVGGQEVQHGQLAVEMTVTSASSYFELRFNVVGTVEVECTRCLAPMQIDIHTQSQLRVKLGEAFEDDGELVTVPADKPELNAAWHIYETIALAIPIRHVHPEGQCSEAYNALMQESGTGGTDGTDGTGGTGGDPRWEQLRNIISNNK